MGTLYTWGAIGTGSDRRMSLCVGGGGVQWNWIVDGGPEHLLFSCDYALGRIQSSGSASCFSVFQPEWCALGTVGMLMSPLVLWRRAGWLRKGSNGAMKDVSLKPRRLENLINFCSSAVRKTFECHFLFQMTLYDPFWDGRMPIARLWTEISRNGMKGSKSSECGLIERGGTFCFVTVNVANWGGRSLKPY